MPILPQLPMWRIRSIPAGVIIMWPSTNASIPAGWSRETALDGVYSKGNTAGVDPGGTGGATSHDHPFVQHGHTGNSHSHTGGTTSGESVANRNIAGGALISNNHTHTFTVTATTHPIGNNSSPATWTSLTSAPATFEMVFIKSGGGATGFPNSSVTWYNGAAPTGWGTHAGSANRLMKGAAAAGDGGGTSDTGSAHAHASTAHSHPAGATSTHPVVLVGDTSAFTNSGSGVFASAGGHTHPGSVTGAVGQAASGTASPNTDNGDVTPPWKKMLPIQNTSGNSLMTKSVICMWLGTLASIPGIFKLCDGTNGTPDLRDIYVRGAANSGEVGNTGGAATHTHTSASHTHTTDNHTHPSSTSNNSADNSIGTTSGAIAPSDLHTHTIPALASGGTGTSAGATPGATANTSNDPSFKRVAYIQLQTLP